MTKNSISDRRIKELELELATLNLQAADKEQQLAEAKLEQAADDVARATCFHRANSPKQSPSPPKKSPPRSSTNLISCDHSVPAVYTGLRDAYKNKLFVGDIVTLRKGSTGELKHLFCQGDRVRVIGNTSDKRKVIVQHPSYPVHTTVRLSKNVVKEFSNIASANLQQANYSYDYHHSTVRANISISLALYSAAI